MISGRQIKAARALLAWSQRDLAKASGVSEPTIAHLESVDGEPGGRADTGEKVRAALEKAGIGFIGENGDGAGVRLRKRRARTHGTHKGASKAKAMAGEEIEQLRDKSATGEEQQRRKRRLLRGPEEFREMRTDQPRKTKLRR